MNLSRRSFTRTIVLATAGAIFVPKYERWFRPLAVPNGLTLAWPKHQPGDVALLMVESRNVQFDLPAWNQYQTHVQGDQRMTVFWRKLESAFEAPVRLPHARHAQISTFRNVVMVGVDEVPRGPVFFAGRPVEHVGVSHAWVARG